MGTPIDCQGRLFSPPLWLPHREDYRSRVGHNRRVKGKNSIGQFWLRLVVIDHFSSPLPQECRQAIVFLLRDPQVRTCSIVPCDMITYRECLVWPFHYYCTQGSDHTLAAIMFYHCRFSFSFLWRNFHCIP